jgi:hypothetical protein
MAQNTKVNGIWGELMAMENSFILKVRSMMECGDTIKRMAKGSTSTQMEHSIREGGLKISRMDLAQNSGQIHLNLQGSIKRVEKMVLESICGLMELSMRVNGRKMK